MPIITGDEVAAFADPFATLKASRQPTETAQALVEQTRRLHSGSTRGAHLLDSVKSLLPVVATSRYTLAPLLPLFLSLKGRPYTLVNHFPFEPFFRTSMPRDMVLKCGRQVSKSTSLAAQGIIISNSIGYFNTLFVTPLFEMIRRFSTNYVADFIKQSPVRSLWVGSSTSSNVLQRSFQNNSIMFFSYAFLDADRTRGLNCNKCAFDEVQDLDESFIPIIQETMSGSMYGPMNQYTGTPKTTDNTLEKLWRDSSKAEFVVPCRNCRYENIPNIREDLLKMIGPWHEDVSEGRPATICAKCRKPVFPRDGRWHHGVPELRHDVAGYHVPQILMPTHYADPDKWAILLNKQKHMPDHVFLNEVLGESSDQGFKLITVEDLQRAAVLHENTLANGMKAGENYNGIRMLAVDWGGGGENPLKTGQMFISYTVYAVMTLLPSGEIHVLYGYRSLTPFDHHREARIALQLAGKFQCSHIVHDYTGAGALREKIMVDAGYPADRLVPMWYVPTATQDAMRFVDGTQQHPRSHYKVDKARSLAFTCEAIKKGFMKFFKMDYVSSQQPGLLWDFMALVEDKVPTKAPRDQYRIIAARNMSDDFAQAVNIGAWALWWHHQAWPNIHGDEKYSLDPDLAAELNKGTIGPTNDGI